MDIVEAEELTGAHQDDIRLLITTVDNVASLGNAILGGSGKVGDRLTGEGHDGGAGVPLFVVSLAIFDCYLHPTQTQVNTKPPDSQQTSGEATIRHIPDAEAQHLHFSGTI